jgi:hypothetical protein
VPRIRGCASLAAVHARQRGVAEITASLGRQPLGSYGARYPGPEVFPGGEVFPADARTPAELIVAIAGLAVRPPWGSFGHRRSRMP